jgi:hypothetical protein
MKRIQVSGQQIAKILYEEDFQFMPRTGDIIHSKNLEPYEVVQVIIRRNANIVIEVKDYINLDSPLVTSLPFV